MSQASARRHGRCDHCGKATIRDDFPDGTLTLRHEVPECEPFKRLVSTLGIENTVTVDLIVIPDDPS